MKKYFLTMFFIAASMAVSTAAEARYQCEVKLRRGNGIVRQNFVSEARRERRACRNARLQCEDRLDQIRWNRPRTRAYCDVGYPYPVFRNRTVTRHCTATKYGRGAYRGQRDGAIIGDVIGGRRGRRVGRVVGGLIQGSSRNFTRSATGPRRSGVKDRACRKALRACQRTTRRHQYCQIRG